MDGIFSSSTKVYVSVMPIVPSEKKQVTQDSYFLLVSGFFYFDPLLSTAVCDLQVREGVTWFIFFTFDLWQKPCVHFSHCIYLNTKQRKHLLSDWLSSAAEFNNTF